MALTATLSTRKYIIKNFNMHDPAIIYVPPIKNNITSQETSDICAAFQPIAVRLLKERYMNRVIIFCRTYEDVICIHHFIQSLGDSFTEPKGSPNYVE